MSIVITDDQAKINISLNLQRVMAKQGISQRKLAEMTQQPLMTINAIVRGKSEPRIAVAARIAEALEMSLDKLISLPPTGFPSAEINGAGENSAIPA